MTELSSNPGPPPPDPLAIALSKLDPTPHGFDRDALMFAAGRASKTWHIRCWQLVAGVAIGLLSVLAALYATRPTVTVIVERQVILDPAARTK
jgi:hypothetical protein